MKNTDASAMISQLGTFFRRRRIEKSLTLGQAARLVGYTSITGGCNKIARFEFTGQIHHGLLAKLAILLDIDSPTISRLEEQDRRAFFEKWWKWANEPIRPHIVIRLFAAMYLHHPLPDDICGVEEAEEYASNLSRTKRKRCCLVLSNRYSVWWSAEGEVECRTEAVPGEPNSPYMRTRRGRPFLLRTVSNQQIIEAVRWPTR